MEQVQVIEQVQEPGTEQDPADRIGRIGTFREEMAELPKLQRRIVFTAMLLMFGLLLQALFVMPVVLTRFGWGFGVQ